MTRDAGAAEGRSIMDAAVATVIAAIITAAASIAAAVITTRAIRPKEPIPQITKIPAAGIVISIKTYRRLAWIFTFLLYCISAYLVLITLRAEYTLYSIIHQPREAMDAVGRTMSPMELVMRRREVEQQTHTYITYMAPSAGICFLIAAWVTWRLRRNAKRSKYMSARQ
jgi:hypothetical protein